MRKGKRIETRILLMLVFMCLIESNLSIVSHVSAQGTITHGNYQMTMYLSGISGAFVGTTTLTETAVNESLTTYFDTYDIETKTSQSDFRLEHSLGYIGLEDVVSYYDSNSILRKSETTYKIRLDGYQSVTYTASYEYSTPTIIENSATVYDRSYTQRYYEDGALEETTTCRDITTFGDDVNVTVPAGTFECGCLITYYYEGGVLTGHSDTWIDVDGTLIKQEQYDESDEFIGSLVLLSQPNTALFSAMTIPLVGLVIGVVALIGVVFYRSRRKTTSPQGYYNIPIPE